MSVKASYNRKVTPFAKQEKSGRWKPVVGNTFGVKSGAGCPDATPFCDGCYALNEERVFTSVGRLVTANLDALLACGSNAGRMVELLAPLVDQFLRECARADKVSTVPVQRVYRIDWDGDLFNRAYAAAWAEVARRYPHVQFWLYTRSFVTMHLLDLLADVPNLSVFLSVDEDNVSEAQVAKATYPWVRLAFCGRTWDDTEVLATKFDGERKGPRCPELTGRMAMVNPETGVGACVECGLCVYGRNNVRFAIKH